ncbi:MAG TPA: hypothetical protein DCW68_03500 [Rhodospirillaceae bacterium]|nr:MAG: hypothetical protein A2018_07580 [Alphaproteobacteria bacterium GWF2_58_20]HAU29159.1 hypothetical protein [Rhodospirillaceae bacterium]
MQEKFSRMATLPVLGLSLLLGACAMDGMFMPEESSPPPALDAAWQADAQRRDAMVLVFGACRDDAVLMDSQARVAGDPAKYLASARLLETCEAELDADVAMQMVDARMRAMALSIQDNLKGGDVAAARAGLSRFAQAFPGQDLYYADGSSFLDSFSVLLDGRQSSGEMALANAGADVKSEMRRLRFWQRN